MNQQTPVEQICEVGLCTLFETYRSNENSHTVSLCVEEAYRKIRERANMSKKVIIGVSQSINTELVTVGLESQTLFIITLVGTVVDSALIEAQQRMQQFDPRNAVRGRSN